jgi:tetratricopeptide (TPR) repeat protein
MAYHCNVYAVKRFAMILRWSGVLCLLLLFVSAQSQFTQIQQDPQADFKQAKEWFRKEQFSLAYPVFKHLFSQTQTAGQTPAIMEMECRYYYILCGLELNDASVVPMAVSFTELENDPVRVPMLRYHLGEYYFRQQAYARALEQYQQTGIGNLNNTEIAKLKFHQAYGYFVSQQFDKAKPLFDAIRQLPSDPNYTDANYYYGFICFSEKKYPQALAGFQIAEKETEYQHVVPFYITEIYYFSGDMEQALSYGENALRQGNQYYEMPLRQLLGHIWFDKKEFAKAQPYLEQYVNSQAKVPREDLYELSFCYYTAQQWAKAIAGFKQLGGAQDSLAQNSMYLLADAYLKTNDKPNARTAFQFCAANNSNAVQKEVSAFQYAKLSYDLGYMDVALKSFKAFTETYPRSTYLTEARELLVNTLANTSNYKEALSLYQSLGTKSDNMIRMYPRLLYGAAVELINDQQITKADALLTLLLQSPYNNAQLPLAYFWKGEMAYRNGQNTDAIGYLLNYLKNPVTNGEVNITHARYNLGYAYLKTEAYTQARSYFEQVAKTVSAQSSAIEQDAFVRAADCYFMNKEFKQALVMYEQVLNLQLSAADYALYQKAVIAGAMNRNTEKVELLRQLGRKYPGSALAIDALMEVANTYIADENFSAAIPPLEQLAKDANAVSMAPQVYLKMGIAYFNLEKNNESLAAFKKLVSSYPNAQESNDAIDYIRNLFVGMQQPAAFVSFMKDNGKPIAVSEEDSLTYRSAMLRYEARDTAGAGNGLRYYLSQFPRGRYNVEVNYLLAEMMVARQQLIPALPYYQAVADQSPNKYAERATLQAARILYFDKKDYPSAEQYFIKLKTMATQQENRLEAMRGLLRCQFKAQRWKEAATNAGELLQEKGIATDDRMMAGFVVARTHQLDSMPDAAITSYKQVIATGKSEYAAESQYHIAEILLQHNKQADAEKAAFEVIKKFGAWDFWVTRSYILLGDLYTIQKDWFNAEATFKSVADNAVITELKEEAKRKLEMVLQEKNKANQVEQNQ